MQCRLHLPANNGYSGYNKSHLLPLALPQHQALHVSAAAARCCYTALAAKLAAASTAAVGSTCEVSPPKVQAGAGHCKQHTNEWVQRAASKAAHYT
jgi:hypothetical protein